MLCRRPSPVSHCCHPWCNGPGTLEPARQIHVGNTNAPRHTFDGRPKQSARGNSILLCRPRYNWTWWHPKWNQNDRRGKALHGHSCCLAGTNDHDHRARNNVRPACRNRHRIDPRGMHGTRWEARRRAQCRCRVGRVWGQRARKENCPVVASRRQSGATKDLTWVEWRRW